MNEEMMIIPKETNRSSRLGAIVAKVISYVVFVTWAAITAAPLVWMAYSSFKTNPELTKDIYAAPKVLLSTKDSTMKVTAPKNSTHYPKGFLEKIADETTGPIKVKEYDKINSRILILETKESGTNVNLHFILRSDIPDSYVTETGEQVNKIQPEIDKEISVSCLPKKIQSKLAWENFWWNYTSAWIRGSLGMGFVNSLIYTIVSTFLVVILGLMLGYGTTKFQFKTAAAIVAGLIGIGYLLDVNQLIVPLFLMLTNLKLTDTHIGIILVYTAFGLPMSVMLSSTFIKGLPDSLVESAYIDGASPFRTFLSIIVPMTVPVIVTISIMTALGIWNEFLLVLVMASKDATKSLPVGIFSFSSRQGNQLGWQIAGLIIATVPVLIVYFIFQKKIAEGVAGGAIKE